jgi:hypothetical protein
VQDFVKTSGKKKNEIFLLFDTRNLLKILFSRAIATRINLCAPILNTLDSLTSFPERSRGELHGIFDHFEEFLRIVEFQQAKYKKVLQASDQGRNLMWKLTT